MREKNSNDYSSTLLAGGCQLHILSTCSGLTNLHRCNEEKRFEERKRLFNVFELQRLAANAIYRDVKDIVYFDKLGEGAANRAFLIRMRDGFSLVARIPYAFIKPRDMLVASEAATLTFPHSKALPVPKVYGYSATSDNAAGVEYIFIEHSVGQPLSSMWLDTTSEQRRKFVKSLVDLEYRMGAISFPASGSLFFRRDLPAGIPGIAIDSNVGETPDSLIVGPSVAQPLWFGKRAELSIDRGPCKFMISQCKSGELILTSQKSEASSGKRR